ncbi:MAG: malonyl CoA-acyl carrier protein transacylase, partial [Dehalococcoidia bacterium]|nr:malonyl CoA-acyl carrier protein transacylase [Dehalococcoidia bacterium]
ARSISLNVSGPFHSPLMQPAQDALSSLLQTLDFGEPRIPVISGVSGRVENGADALKTLLLQQITAIVRWVDVSSELGRLNIDTAIEVGSGDVLTRLGRRSDSPIRFLTFEEAIHERI